MIPIWKQAAAASNIPAKIVDRDALEDTLTLAIESFSPDLAVLAVFMRILGNAFVQRFHGRLINTHHLYYLPLQALIPIKEHWMRECVFIVIQRHPAQCLCLS